MPKEFDRAFSRSAALVLEADVEQLASEEFALHLVSQMVLPDGKTLQSILDSDVYDLLSAECAKYGLPIDAVSKFKPSMVVTMISMLQIQEFGFVEEGVDAHYLQMAKNKNKPVYYLETAQSQIDAFLSMGDGYENDYVRYSLYDMGSTEDEITMLVTDWKRGDVSRSEMELAEMKEEWPDIYKALLTDRHAAWMPQIEGFLASGQVHFVITGLLHMHGPDGLLQQLRDSGCTVEQFR
jgi:uncharacterized protein YbaP (TraB family)